MIAEPPEGPPHTAEDLAGDPPDEGNRATNTDTWLAERFVAERGENLRYCGTWKKWHTYRQGRWAEDAAGRAASQLKQTVLALLPVALREEDPKKQKEKVAFAYKSQSAKARRDALALAQLEPEVQVEPHEFDADHWLFNCANGTVDLRTGKLRPHAREDLLRKRSPVVFDAAAGCPLWLKFLDRVLAGDQDLIAFVQGAVGYSLTGETDEHMLLLLWGTGQNGKSTLIEVLLWMFGTYGGVAAPGLLMSTRNERHPTELADLFGARMVTSSESEEQGHFNESRVKWLTGGDSVKARRMGEDFWDFMPTHKFWLATNYKPRIQGTDTGIWRRIRLIPFEVEIPEAERDRGLKKKLRAELAGIFNWALAGCLRWQQEGLPTPKKVTDATAKYRVEEDRVAGFIAERCEIGTKDCSGSSLYSAYTVWAEANRERVMSKRAFGTRLDELGYAKKEGGLMGTTRLGICLRVVESSDQNQNEAN